MSNNKFQPVAVSPLVDVVSDLQDKHLYLIYATREQMVSDWEDGYDPEGGPEMLWMIAHWDATFEQFYDQTTGEQVDHSFEVLVSPCALPEVSKEQIA